MKKIFISFCIVVALIVIVVLQKGYEAANVSAQTQKFAIEKQRLFVSDSDSDHTGVIEVSNGRKTNYIFTQGKTGDFYLRTDGKNYDLLLQAGGEQGKVGIGTDNPQSLLQVGNASCDGNKWITASSREFKKDISPLSPENAQDTLSQLNPVLFRYKTDDGTKHVGFIAEDVPDLVATKDRKGLSAMDIVAVLTKVMQEQQKRIDKLESEVRTLSAKK